MDPLRSRLRRPAEVASHQFRSPRSGTESGAMTVPAAGLESMYAHNSVADSDGGEPCSHAHIFDRSIPLTADDTNFLNATRGNFPGDDDQLLLAGRQACRLLYTGQGAQATIDATAATYGASPQQAAGLVNAARGTLCTQAPG